MLPASHRLTTPRLLYSSHPTLLEGYLPRSAQPFICSSASSPHNLLRLTEALPQRSIRCRTGLGYVLRIRTINHDVERQAALAVRFCCAHAHVRSTIIVHVD